MQARCNQSMKPRCNHACNQALNTSKAERMRATYRRPNGRSSRAASCCTARTARHSCLLRAQRYITPVILITAVIGHHLTGLHLASLHVGSLLCGMHVASLRADCSSHRLGCALVASSRLVLLVAWSRRVLVRLRSATVSSVLVLLLHDMLRLKRLGY